MKFSIKLPTYSIPETVSFYKEHLGLNFVTASSGFFAFYEGMGYQIQFQKPDAHLVTDGICFHFEFDNAKELYDKMVEKKINVNITEHPSETFNFNITDNNGYKICISSRIENKSKI